MEKNIHPVERVVRVVAGLGIASLAFWGPQSPWFLLGLLPVLSGAVSFCPLYRLLGINTAKACKKGGCCCTHKPE